MSASETLVRQMMAGSLGGTIGERWLARKNAMPSAGDDGFLLSLAYVANFSREVEKTMQTAAVFLTIAGWLLLPPTLLASPLTITDITVVSTNSDGENWNSLIWNTQGGDTDQPAPGRFNLYVTPDPLTVPTPTFLNGFNDVRTRIALPLTVGDQSYSIFGDGVNVAFDPRQHFVLNVYFDSDQSMPGVSGVQNLQGTALAPAGHPNGLDIFGDSGQQEAGTLSVATGGHLVTLTSFSWITNGQRNVVWDYWANDAPYNSGNNRLDYYGSFTINVRTLPAPGTLALLGAGLVGVRLRRRWS